MVPIIIYIVGLSLCYLQAVPVVDDETFIPGVCPDMTWCPLTCHDTFLRDHNECPLCQCDTKLCEGEFCPTGTECKLLNFATQHGYNNLQYKCISANELVPQCGYPSCEFHNTCPQPYATQPDGCEVCQCDPEYKSYLSSSSFSNGGRIDNHVINQNSSSEISNIPSQYIGSICSNEERTTCFKQCPIGFEYDSNGCFKCQCLESYDNDEALCKEYGEDMTNCHLRCRQYEVNVYGCQMCSCVPPKDCPIMECPQFCSRGYVKDERGCLTCTCQVQGTCDMTYLNAHCNWTECVFGYAQDENGCDLCECNKNSDGFLVDHELKNKTNYQGHVDNKLNENEGETSPSKTDDDIERMKIIIIAVVMSIVVIVLIILLVIVIYCLVKNTCKKSDQYESQTDTESDQISIQELSEKHQENESLIDTREKEPLEVSNQNTSSLTTTESEETDELMLEPSPAVNDADFESDAKSSEAINEIDTLPMSEIKNNDQVI